MWEIESQHLDLSEMEHVTVFVERGVKTRSGEPARHLLQIRLAGEGGLTVNEKGELSDADGAAYDHRAKQTEVLAHLNGLHNRARAFAQRHNIPLGRGAAR